MSALRIREARLKLPSGGGFSFVVVLDIMWERDGARIAKLVLAIDVVVLESDDVVG